MWPKSLKPRALGRLVVAWLSRSRSASRIKDCPELSSSRLKPTIGRPKRLVRTVLASIAESKVFGKQMEREAKLEGDSFGGQRQGVPGGWVALELVNLEEALPRLLRRSWISSTC